MEFVIVIVALLVIADIYIRFYTHKRNTMIILDVCDELEKKLDKKIDRLEAKINEPLNNEDQSKKDNSY